MKLHIPKNWLHGISDHDESPLAGPAPDLAGLGEKLQLEEKLIPSLLPYWGEMVKRGWIEDKPSKQVEPLLILLDRYPQASPALLRGSVVSEAVNRASDPRLSAWLAYLNTQSLLVETKVKYKGLTLETLRRVATFSTESDGPRKAVAYLRSLGVIVLLTRAISGTRVDGCAFWSLADRPLIGLSARFDRLDNFWFSLLHECAHVALHVKGSEDAFADDFEEISEVDELEIEANQAAADAAIPRATWKRSKALRWPTRSNIEELASEVGIHPSIVAGRVRFEKKDYRLFGNLLGQGEISKMFNLESDPSS